MLGLFATGHLSFTVSCDSSSHSITTINKHTDVCSHEQKWFYRTNLPECFPHIQSFTVMSTFSSRPKYRSPATSSPKRCLCVSEFGNEFKARFLDSRLSVSIEGPLLAMVGGSPTCGRDVLFHCHILFTHSQEFLWWAIPFLWHGKFLA